MEGVDVHFNQQRVGSFSMALENPTIRYPFPFILGQPEVEAAFERVLNKRGFHVERASEVVDVQVRDDYVDITLKNGERINARFVVGCDGAHSLVRHSLPDWKFEGRPVNLLWAQCDGTITDARVHTTRGASFIGPNGLRIIKIAYEQVSQFEFRCVIIDEDFES